MIIQGVKVPDKVVDSLFQALVDTCGFKNTEDTRQYAIELIIMHLKFIDSIGGIVTWKKHTK